MGNTHAKAQKVLREEQLAAALSIKYLPMGRAAVHVKDNPMHPISFIGFRDDPEHAEKRRDRFLRTFYCNDKKLYNKARREARKLGLI